MARKSKQQRRSSRSHQRLHQRRPVREGGRANDWQIARVHQSTAPLGPDIVTASWDEVLQAIERAPRGDDWGAVRDLVIPVIPRVRPHPPGTTPPLRILLPPGIHVGFGVDIGPAFMAVSAEQLKTLGVSESELVTRALGNLGSRAARVQPGNVVRQSVNGTPVVALQTGESIGSTLVLVPDEIARIFGPEPRLFIAPMRDVLLGFPADADPWVAASLYEEIANQDPNCLPPIAFRFDGERIMTASFVAEPPLSRRLLA